MMENDIQIKLEDGTLMIKLGMELTAFNAPPVINELLKYYGQDIKKVIFDATQLAYLASAGVRVIFYAHTKLGCDPEIVFVNLNKNIKEVLNHIGLSPKFKFEESKVAEKKYRREKLLKDGLDALKQEAQKRQDIIDNYSAHNDIVCYTMKIGEED